MNYIYFHTPVCSTSTSASTDMLLLSSLDRNDNNNNDNDGGGAGTGTSDGVGNDGGGGDVHTTSNQPTNQPTYKFRKRIETSNAYGRFSISGSQKVSSVDGRWCIEL